MRDLPPSSNLPAEKIGVFGAHSPRSSTRELTGASAMQTGDREGMSRVLVLAAQDWPLTAFLAIGLRRAGFVVSGLCPRDHALRHTDSVDRCYPFSASRPWVSLRAAIRACKPEILVPGDDQSAYAIYELHARCRGDTDADATTIVELIERSLGDPDSFPIARSKSALIRVARECGVAIPETQEIEGLAGLKKHCETAKPPFVLRQDGTFGGLGVIVAQDRREAEKALKRLKVRRVVNAGRELALKFNYRPLLAALTAPLPVISVQQFIDGRPANRATLCWRGRVLAGTTVQTLEADPFPNGPATVVEFIREPEIDRAVESLVARLGLSGFCGFDFMLARESGRPFLLELNPRATSASWLGTAGGSDLCAALFRALASDGGNAVPNVPAGSEEAAGEKAALFPQEWMRARTSPHLATAYHRVPWQDRRLVAFLARCAYAGEGGKPLGLLSRLARRVVLGKDWQLKSDGGRRGKESADPEAPSASREGRASAEAGASPGQVGRS
jgi:ATP-grasp domain